MPKYRKKPIVIKAEQWLPEEIETPKPKEPDRFGVVWEYDAHGQVARGSIETLEGNYTVTIGDWIIIGVKGEKYPCKPDIFEQTYELVTE